MIPPTTFQRGYQRLDKIRRYSCRRKLKILSSLQGRSITRGGTYVGFFGGAIGLAILGALEVSSDDELYFSSLIAIDKYRGCFGDGMETLGGRKGLELEGYVICEGKSERLWYDKGFYMPENQVSGEQALALTALRDCEASGHIRVGSLGQMCHWEPRCRASREDIANNLRHSLLYEADLVEEDGSLALGPGQAIVQIRHELEHATH
nr:hypothetical protein Iba_chr12aCG10460 [Ipomoea batatas]